MALLVTGVRILRFIEILKLASVLEKIVDNCPPGTERELDNIAWRSRKTGTVKRGKGGSVIFIAKYFQSAN